MRRLINSTFALKWPTSSFRQIEQVPKAFQMDYDQLILCNGEQFRAMFNEIRKPKRHLHRHAFSVSVIKIESWSKGISLSTEILYYHELDTTFKQ